MNRIVLARKKWIDSLHNRNLYSILDCYSNNHVFKGTMNHKVTDRYDDTRRYFERFLKDEPIVTFITSDIKDMGDTFMDYGTYSFKVKEGFVHANYQFIYRIIDNNPKIVSHFSCKI